MRWCLAALVVACACAGEADIRVVRGPWQWRAADGSPRLACAVVGTVTPAGILSLDGNVLPVTETVHRDGEGVVLVARLPAGTHGDFRWIIAGAVLDGSIGVLPAPDAATRLMLVSAGAWPSAEQVTGFAKHLGGPPQLVLVLGEGAAHLLGTGGWEATVPVAVIAPGGDAALSAATDGDAERWRFGCRVGCLGLPASPDRGRADLAIARDLSPWLAYCDAPSAWDPAISRPTSGSLQDLAVLITACSRMRVPLVLGAGRSGFISEPLAPSAPGRIQAAAKGVRYVCPVPAAEDGLANIDEAIAMPLEVPLLAGLAADVQHLELVFARPGEATALRQRWQSGNEEERLEVDALLTRLAKAEEFTAPTAVEALDRLWQAPRPALSAAAIPTAAQLARMRDEGGAAGRALVRRLQLVRVDDPAFKPPEGDPDPFLVHDVLLWRITRIRGREAIGWRDEAAATTDTLILRTLLRDVARDPEHELLPVLVQRVSMQAAGTLPLDADPLLQHKLFSAVFDAPTLSPSPLRPMAVVLRGKVSELGRGPIERFLKRNGEVREP